MRKLKALLSIALTSILALGLAACSGGNSAAPAGSNAGGAASDGASQPANGNREQISLRFAWWGDGARHEKYNAIADLFEQQHPHIKIVREFGAFNDYWDKMATQTAGGNAPDIQGMHATYVADYARRGTLLELTPYIEDGTIDLTDFPQSVQDAGKVDGKTVMVAQGVTMTGWEYNTAMFDKLNVAYPDFNWTWDDFEAKLTELQAAITEDGVWASIDDSGSITSLQVFARQRGKELFDEEGKLGVDTDDLVAWFAIWDRLRQKGVIPDAATTEQYSNVSLDQGLLVKGKVALSSFPYNQIPLYQNYMPEGEVRALRRPSDPNGPAGEFIEGAYLAVSAKSSHPKEAAQFIDFFVNNGEALQIFKLEQGALGSTKGNELIKPLLEPAEVRTVEAIEETLQIAGQIPLPPAGQGAVRTLLTESAQSIAFGQRTVEQAAQDFVDKATDILG